VARFLWLTVYIEINSNTPLMIMKTMTIMLIMIIISHFFILSITTESTFRILAA